MSTAYRRNNYGSGPPLSDPFWFAVAVVFTATMAAIALPAIIISLIARRYLSRRLHWKLSMLTWLVLSLLGGFILWQNYFHGWGLANEVTQVLILYISQIKQHQADLLHWDFLPILKATGPLWLQTLLGIGIAGLWFETCSNASTNIVQTLRQNEHRRQQQAQRSGQSARRRTSRPDRLPDETGGMAVMGVPIKRKRNE